MLKIRLVTAAGILALGCLIAGPSAAQTKAPSAAQAGRPASAVAGGAVAVVVDPETRTAVIVPINTHAGMPADVNATLAALYATGKIRPSQVSQIVVRRKGRISEVIASPPVPNSVR